MLGDDTWTRKKSVYCWVSLDSQLPVLAFLAKFFTSFSFSLFHLWSISRVINPSTVPVPFSIVILDLRRSEVNKLLYSQEALLVGQLR